MYATHPHICTEGATSGLYLTPRVEAQRGTENGGTHNERYER